MGKPTLNFEVEGIGLRPAPERLSSTQINELNRLQKSGASLGTMKALAGHYNYCARVRGTMTSPAYNGCNLMKGYHGGQLSEFMETAKKDAPHP